MMTKKNLLGSAFAVLLLVGCGGSGGSNSTTTGYLVDSAVANADYDCTADGRYNKTTGVDGSFTCTDMSQVRFRIGKLVLGDIHSLHADKHVFPQDLVGVARDTGVNDARVIAMAQLLQSLDSDGNPGNGITIAQETKVAVAETEKTFNPTELTIYQDSASAVYRPTHAQAQQHLEQTLQSMSGTAHDTAQDAQNTAQDNAQNAHSTAQNTAQDNAQNTHSTAQDTAQNAQGTAQTMAGM